jgi:hypothetical protein
MRRAAHGVVIGDEAGVFSKGAHARETRKGPRLDHHAGDLRMAGQIFVGRSCQRGHVVPRDRPLWPHPEHVAIELHFEHRPFLLAEWNIPAALTTLEMAATAGVKPVHVTG